MGGWEVGLDFVTGQSKESLLSSLGHCGTLESGTGGAMEPKILDRNQTAIFLKSYYSSNFDEREVKKLDPKDLLD